VTIKNIYVCDDKEALAKGWADEIRAKAGNDVTVERIEDPGSEFKKLLRRIPREGRDIEGEVESAFDKADVLVVDYDLLEVDADQARHTGEGFARTARLYSDCGLVIVMNQFVNEAAFDLSLTGHLHSFADLNIDDRQVELGTLWGAKRDGSIFAPWHWPDLESALVQRKALIERVEDRLDESLLEAIQFPIEMTSRLSDRAFGFLFPLIDGTPGPVSPTENLDKLKALTVRQFLLSMNEHKEFERAIEANPKRAASAATARIAKWYSRAVVAPQDLLVDVPHLLQRMPFLLRSDFGDVGQIKTWNDAIEAGSDALIPELSECEFAPSKEWIGRSSYWWPKISNHPKVTDLRSKFDLSTFPDVVFAEDASCFIDQEEAVAFRAGFFNQYDIRYIKFFKDVHYGPARRLASV
jgi:hypothetical protein